MSTAKKKTDAKPAHVAAMARTPSAANERPPTLEAPEGAFLDHQGVDLVFYATQQVDVLLLAIENVRELSACLCPGPEDFEQLMKPLRAVRNALRTAVEYNLEGCDAGRAAE